MASKRGNLALKSLVHDVKALIREARQQAFVAVNAGMTLLYWRIGKRIEEEVLRGKRAEYGEEVVRTLAGELTHEYGGSFGEKNLRRMRQFAVQYPDEKIVVALLRQLSWTHFLVLIPIKDSLKREFYTELCQLEGWSSRKLRERINSQLFERTALSRKGEQTIRHDLEQLRHEGNVSPELLLRDPYLLNFLGLQDRFLEKDLEDAILRDLESFLLELGAGFSFVARQKRIQIDDEDFFIDLLLYNRKLKRLVVVDLKIGEFEAAFKGQMELYLRYLAKYEQEPGEASPLGIILCTGKKQEHIELLELGKSDIHVAEYLTVLPPRQVLRAKLQAALEQARQQLETRQLHDDD
jgi:predicted nuclease of restriction endonuclease-like (RecB) superfamily